LSAWVPLDREAGSCGTGNTNRFNDQSAILNMNFNKVIRWETGLFEPAAPEG